jgi:hypothetical protein
MERNRNTGNCIIEIKLFALCMGSSDFIFVLEDSFCDIVNGLFRKLRRCDQSSFDRYSLYIVVNALVGAARNTISCVERMCISKDLCMLIVYSKKVDRVCCSELYDRCCRSTCCTEESIDLAIF